MRIARHFGLVPAAVLACTLAAAQDFDKVRIKTLEVTDGFHVLKGLGGNIGVSSGADGVLLVDDQFAPLTDKILAAVAEIHDGPVRFVINTHWHGDHVGGNERLGKAGAVVVAHDNVRTRMSVEQFMEVYNQRVEQSPRAALPIVTFSESATFHMNGDLIRVVHIPAAHTDGDSVVHFVNADVIHAGDVYFNGIYPYIDNANGGSIDGMIAGVKRLLDMAGADTKIVAGHGDPVSGRDELAAYLELLETVREKVSSLMAEGKSAEEIQQARPTAEFDEKWSSGWIKPENLVTLVHDSLSR